MTLPSRHRIWNSIPDGLRPSTLPLGHDGSPQYWIFNSERERNICYFETWMPEQSLNPLYPTLTTAPEPPPIIAFKGLYLHCSNVYTVTSCFIIHVYRGNKEWKAGRPACKATNDIKNENPAAVCKANSLKVKKRTDTHKKQHFNLYAENEKVLTL